GDETPTQITGRGDAERRTQASAGAAVVGNGDDGRDVARVAARRPQGRRQTVAAAESDDCRAVGQRETSRCCTVGSKPRLARSLASSSAMTTERWRPPVHPTATERYDLPSLTKAGSSRPRRSSTLARNSALSGWS